MVPLSGPIPPGMKVTVKEQVLFGLTGVPVHPAPDTLKTGLEEPILVITRSFFPLTIEFFTTNFALLVFVSFTFLKSFFAGVTVMVGSLLNVAVEV